jgi:hypothetical protein
MRKMSLFVGPFGQAVGSEKSALRAQGGRVLSRKEVTGLPLDKTFFHSFREWLRASFFLRSVGIHLQYYMVPQIRRQ